VTDYEGLAREMDAATPGPNGRDPLEVSGVAALRQGCDLGDVAMALRTLVPLLPADVLARRVIRNRTIATLKEAAIIDAAGLVDAAFPRPATDGDAKQGQAVTAKDPEPWPEPVPDGAALLQEVRDFLARFIVLPAGADDVLASFALHTYAVAAFEAVAYVVLHSPVRRCGKTRALEILELLVWRPWQTVVLSTAVLFRSIERDAPTVLLDEAEVVRGRGEAAENVRALLNAGYKRGGTVRRCVGDDQELRDFRVFCPKVFALIGKLPPTTFDRCIAIAMQRRKRGQEKVDALRRKRIAPAAERLRRMARRWAQDAITDLAAAAPALPDFLDDRQQEIWEPLFAVAEVAGGTWPGRLTEAARILSGTREVGDDVKAGLLADIWAIFAERDAPAIFSADLAETLAAMEGRRWGEWGKRGKPITPNGVAELLADFGIVSRTVRIGDRTAKGYPRQVFADAFARYVRNVTPSQPSGGAAFLEKPNSGFEGSNPEMMAERRLCDGVTADPSGRAEPNPEMMAETEACDGVTVWSTGPREIGEEEWAAILLEGPDPDDDGEPEP